MTPTRAHPTLVLRDAHVERDARMILSAVDLALEPGRVHVVLGPNGAGKTTLLRCLIGLVPLSRGTVELAGRSLAHRSRKRIARHVTYLPQRTEGTCELTVQQTVWMGRYPHLRRLAAPSARDHAAVEAAIERMSLTPLRARALDTLSGGERQRVLIARSLATEAPIWLLDEPTASLDPRHALEILSLLRAEARLGRTIVVVLHDLNLALRFGDRFVLLRDGRILAEGDHARPLRPDLLELAYDVKFHAHELAGIPQLTIELP